MCNGNALFLVSDAGGTVYGEMMHTRVWYGTQLIASKNVDSGNG